MAYVLGVNGPPVGMHDAAAALVDQDGNVLFVAEEERFSRHKHALHEGPRHAIRRCLAAGEIMPSDVQTVAVGWDLPAFRASDGERWTSDDERAFVDDVLGWPPGGRRPEVVYVNHHLAHATAAFYAAGVARAAVLVVDGQGEAEATSIYRGEVGQPMRLCRAWPKSHSLGFMYDAVSRWLGFTFLEAGLTMGLAAYGRAARQTPFELFRSSDDGYVPTLLSPKSDYWDVLAAWRTRIVELSGANGPTALRQELDCDPMATRMAWSAQHAVETVLLGLAEMARRATGEEELCIGGGVALNCSANAAVPGPTSVSPVPHDAGVALGAAWYVAPPQEPMPQFTPYLGLDAGTSASPHEDMQALVAADFDVDDVVARLERGDIGAIVEGRAEVGPRALCHRSIVSLASEERARDRVNRLKGRESWRPFGPVAEAHSAARLWSGDEALSRYMVGTAELTNEGAAAVPAVRHVDGTTRPQIVDPDRCGVVTAILRGLDAAGHTPVLINTSFNARGEPIVNSAADALDAFSRLRLDFMILNDHLVARQPLRRIKNEIW